MKNVKLHLENIILSAALFLPMCLPYRLRVPLAGFLAARVVAPLAGYSRRVRENLLHTQPDLPEADIRALCRAVPDNATRTLMEVYSGERFVAEIRKTSPTGPGVAALEEARKAGRPIIVFSGHFGNYDAPRAALRLLGHQVGALYRPFKNPYFDRHYRSKITAIAAPIFPQGRRGLADMVRFLREGNTIALLTDQYATAGLQHDFLGKPSRTPMSAAQMALKYDALLVPVYGIRRDDGLSFDIVFEAPIDHSDAETMTRELMASLENRIKDNPAQWLWVHRKWKTRD